MGEGVSERKDKSGEFVKPFKGVIFLTDLIGKKIQLWHSAEKVDSFSRRFKKIKKKSCI